MTERVTEDLEVLMGQVATEFFERLSNGESPSIEEYEQRYPEVAEMIRHALPALQRVSDSMGDGFRSQPAPDEKYEKRLGDFLIHRELGRGGMGIVYEAEQISMGGRKVALKVLPFAAMADASRLQRFRNEIQAAASLDHPNIVSVYSVGEQRGVHFYSMQLIQGQSLSELIADLKALKQRGPLDDSALEELATAIPSDQASSADEPTEDFRGGPEIEPTQATPRSRGSKDTVAEVRGQISTKGSGGSWQYAYSVAKLGIQAAEALAHAHERGVIHRDIKPGNLMIDANAQLHITDFGLAQMEQNVGVTMTGDLVGTLRYMSPEQALGKRVAIDHRADIYSLGISLYELLTMRPAFEQESRGALIKQIAFDEPPRLRHVDPTLPRDLETIIHKAISKNPDERYVSAQDLADDLRAFIESRPIAAKRPTWIDRGRKWTYRNQGFVLAGCILLFISTLGSFVGAVLVNRQKNEAIQQRELAESNLKYARETVNTYLTKVSEDRLLNTPSMQPLRKELLELALSYYEGFIQEHPRDPKLQSELADALIRVGDIEREIGSQADALKSYEQAVAVRKQLPATSFDLKEKLALAAAYRDLASQYERIGNVDLHHQCLKESLLLLEQTELEHGKLSDISLSRARTLRQMAGNANSLQEGLDNALQALEIVRQLASNAESEMPIDELASCLYAIGNAYFDIVIAARDGDKVTNLRNAARYYELARDEQQKVVAHTGKLLDREILAKIEMNLGITLGKVYDLLREQEEGREILLASRDAQVRATSILESLAHENPLVSDYRLSLSVLINSIADSYRRLAMREEEASHFDEAARHTTRAIEIAQKLNYDFPGLPSSVLNNAFRGQSRTLFYVVQSTWLSDRRKQQLVERALSLTLKTTAAKWTPDDRYNLCVVANLAALIPTAEESNLKRLIDQSITALLAVPDKDRDADEWGWLGGLLYRTGRYDESLATFRKCTELHGDRGPTVESGARWWYIVMLDARNGNVVDARRNYDILTTEAKLVEKKLPIYIDEVRELLGIDERETEASSEQMLQILVVADSNLWRPFLPLGFRLLDEGKRELARTAFATAAERLQELPEDEITVADWGFLAQALYGSGNYAEAERALSKNFGGREETRPTITNGPRWWYKAMLLGRAGNKKEARKIYYLLVDEIANHAAPDLANNERFRRELAELLDITDPPPDPPAQAPDEVSTQSR